MYYFWGKWYHRVESDPLRLTLNLWEYGSRRAHTFHQVRDEEAITKRYGVSAGQKYHCQPVTVGEIENNKKNMSEPSDKLSFTKLLECAGASRYSPLCQVPHCDICEHAHQLLFASVFGRRHTTGKQNLYQTPFLCFTVQGSQFWHEDCGGGLHFEKQPFYLRILAFTC